MDRGKVTTYTIILARDVFFLLAVVLANHEGVVVTTNNEFSPPPAVDLMPSPKCHIRCSTLLVNPPRLDNIHTF